MEANANPAAGKGDSSRRARARAALDGLAGLEAEMRGSAVISADGEVLASTVDDADWQRSAKALVASLEKEGEDLDNSHIATEDAEVFVVREAGMSLVAVTARFVLASLTSFDMRMSLRDLARESADA